MYVLDRGTGEVLSADPFVRVNAAHGVDLKTGRLVPNKAKEPKLNRVVREITMRDDTMIVRCANGEVHEADDVVLTAPPSTWHNIRFSPGLPRAIRPQMGTAVKYLGAVKSRFWLVGRGRNLPSPTRT